MTNYEKIKAMSVEEMASALDSRSICEEIHDTNLEFCLRHDTCGECLKDWLLQEAEE